MKIASPHIPPVLTEKENLLEEIENFSYTIEESAFSEQPAAGVRKSGLSFSCCRFIKCNFSEGKFPDGNYCDVVFTNCNLSNADLSECRFTRVEFIDCKLSGTNLAGSMFNHVVWKNCQCRYLIFSLSRLSNVLFHSSVFRGCAMDECKPEKIWMEDCDFSETVFFRTPLKDINFSSCHIENIRITAWEVKGIIVTPFQAMDLAQILGIRIEE